VPLPDGWKEILGANTLKLTRYRDWLQTCVNKRKAENKLKRQETAELKRKRTMEAKNEEGKKRPHPRMRKNKSECSTK
jgi:hypothetical protein